MPMHLHDAEAHRTGIGLPHKAGDANAVAAHRHCPVLHRYVPAQQVGACRIVVGSWVFETDTRSAWPLWPENPRTAGCHKHGCLVQKGVKWCPTNPLHSEPESERQDLTITWHEHLAACEYSAGIEAKCVEYLRE